MKCDHQLLDNEQQVESKSQNEQKEKTTDASNTHVGTTQSKFVSVCELNLSNNWLGDAGVAALLRTLPLARTIRRLHLQKTGVGRRSVEALCEILTMTFPVALPVSATMATREECKELESVCNVSLPLLPLEYIDLRGNPLFAISGRMLVNALHKRKYITNQFNKSIHCCSKEDMINRAVCHWGLSLVDIELDLENFPATIATKLLEYHKEYVGECKHHAKERQEALVKEKLHYFTMSHSSGYEDGVDGKSSVTGEQIIYRIPYDCGESNEEKDHAEHIKSAPNADISSYSSQIPSELQLKETFCEHCATTSEFIAAINDYMSLYLKTFSYCTRHLPECDKILPEGLHKCNINDNSDECTEATIPMPTEITIQYNEEQQCKNVNIETQFYVNDDKLAPECKIAAQLCVEFGPRMLLYFPQIMESTLMSSVNKLLHSFHVHPFLEDELTHSHFSSSADNDWTAQLVVSTYLPRLRNLYYYFAQVYKQSIETKSKVNHTIDDNINTIEYTSNNSDDNESSNTNKYSNSVNEQATRSCEFTIKSVEENKRLHLEMQSLYTRIVSAIVASPFNECHVPSLRWIEDKVSAIRYVVLNILYDGADVSQYMSEDNNTVTNKDNNSDTSHPEMAKHITSIVKELWMNRSTLHVRVPSKIWTLWASQVEYLEMNLNQNDVQKWNASYCSLNSSEVTGMETQEIISTRNEHFTFDHCMHCTCKELHKTIDAAEWSVPCPACCYTALQILMHMICSFGDKTNNKKKNKNCVNKEAATEETTTEMQRWGVLHPIMSNIPEEMQLFLFELVITNSRLIRKSSNALFYNWMPRLFTSMGSLQQEIEHIHRNIDKIDNKSDNTNIIDNNSDENKKQEDSELTKEPVSLLDYLACAKSEREGVEELMNAFSEWYRLKLLQGECMSDVQ